MDVEDVHSRDSSGPTLDALREAIATSGQGMTDTSVERLWSTTGGPPNPSKAAHVAALRVWLNAWNCRIPYPTGDIDPLVASLDAWWRTHRRRLVDVPLIDLDDGGLDAYAHAYADLVDLEAGVSNIGRVRSLAPTASSKLLWVLRQHTACPWDAAIAKAGGFGSGKVGYANHLHKAREWARDITAAADSRGVDNIPAHVGRPHSSLVRIYDEWCYLTFTRGPVS
jgi:hypothetical protein